MNFRPLPLPTHGKTFNDYYPDTNPALPSSAAHLLLISQQVDAVRHAADTRIAALAQLGSTLSKTASSGTTNNTSTHPTSQPHNVHEASSKPSQNSAPTSKIPSSGGLASTVGGSSNKGGTVVDPNIVAATLPPVQQAQLSATLLQTSPVLAATRQTSPQTSPSMSLSQRLPKSTVPAIKLKNPIREDVSSKDVVDGGRSTSSPSPFNSMVDPNKKRKRDGNEDNSADTIVSVSTKLEDGATINMQLINSTLKLQKTMPNRPPTPTPAMIAPSSTPLPAASTNHLPPIPTPVKGTATPTAKGKPGKTGRQNSTLPSGGKARTGSRRKTDNDAPTATHGNASAGHTPLPVDVSLGGGPPPMPEGDLSKVAKPANQIPINQFWAYADQYFRDLAEEDIQWLGDKGYDVVAYTIPPLGRSWREVLQEQDAGIYSGSPAAELSPRYDQVPDDSLLLPGDAYFGPLTERVVAGLQAVGIYDDAYWKNWLDAGLLDASNGSHNNNNNNNNNHNNATNSTEPTDKVKAGSKAEMTDLEDRIKRELRYLGVIPEEEHPADWEATDEDEITQELKKRQAELRKQVEINQSRKQKLREVAIGWKAWQEYSDVLEELNKQVYAAYAKRYQKTSSKKKKLKPLSAPRPLAEHTLQLLDKRRQLIQEIGKRIPPALHTIPTKSIYSNDHTTGGIKVAKDEEGVLQNGHCINGHVNGSGEDVAMADGQISSSTVG
ncbi:hypothetical protein SeLEV6574_g04627 [Synchytrium endobioticum]|nr:hypothetical protein SeLEV6574_g04627 [Synchytrium endobioticum]